MMRSKLWIIGIFLIICSLSSCSLQSNKPQISPPNTDKATYYGRIVDKNGKPIPRTAVYIAEVVRQGEEGAFVWNLGFSPGDETDEDGYFAIENVEVKEYVVIVGNPFLAYIVIKDTSNKPRVFFAQAGQSMDLGSLRVDLNP